MLWEQGLSDQKRVSLGNQRRSAGRPGTGWSWHTGVNSARVLVQVGGHVHTCAHSFYSAHRARKQTQHQSLEQAEPPDGPSSAGLPRGRGNQGCSEKQLPPSGAAAQDVPGARKKEHPRVTAHRGRNLTGPIWDGQRQHQRNFVQELTTNRVKQKGIYESRVRRNTHKHEQEERGSGSRGCHVPAGRCARGAVVGKLVASGKDCVRNKRDTQSSEEQVGGRAPVQGRP